MVDDNARPWVENVVGNIIIHEHHNVLLLHSSLLQYLVRVAHIGLVPVVPVAGGARDEHGPPRPHFILPRRRGSPRSSSSSRSVTPLLRGHPYQRLPLPLPLRPIRRGGPQGEEREESTQPEPRCSHRRSASASRVGASE
uniref:Uncharacterized protein n=1 Tax=Arundo donax TaxID=35708 RepID=A0A0A9GQ49_ARUDO